MLKRFISVLLIIVMTIGFLPSQTSNATIGVTCWYSDDYKIGWWESNYLKVYCNKLNSNNSFYFLDGMTHATGQWTGALGITVSSGISGYYATDPQVYYSGGTRAEIETVWDGLVPSDNTGHTRYFYYYNCPIYFNSHSFSGETLVFATGYIVDMGNPLSTMKKTCTHELGHALGWFGHSSDSSDIMYSLSSSITALSSRDKAHLSQVY